MQGTVFTVTSTLDATRLAVSRGKVRMSTRTGASRTAVADEALTTAGAAIVPDPGQGLDEAAADVLADPLRGLRESTWYQHRFASLLQLRDYLSEHKVPADEVALLAVSAEPWCLQRPRAAAVGASDFLERKAGLQRAADWYGCQVRWPASATREEATALVGGALTGGALVLAYGLEDSPVRIRGIRDLDGSQHPPAWSYRFLGETATSPFALCVIDPPVDASALRPVQVRQAIADIQASLAGGTDEAYDIGLQCVQPAAATESVPVIKALTALGRLGPACEGWLCRQAGRPEPGHSLYGLLDREVAAVFAAWAFEETCGREALLEQSADRCVVTLQGLARVVGGQACN